MSGWTGRHPDDYPSVSELAEDENDWQERMERVFHDRRKEMEKNPKPYDESEPF